MKLEHVAWQVPNPPTVADWYVAHLGFTIARQMDQSPWTTFIKTADGAVLIEIYHNPAAPLPDYPNQDPLVLHLAFAVEDIEGERARLLAAGCTIETDLFTIPNGDQILMLRDPWGFALQLVRRSTPLL